MYVFDHYDYWDTFPFYMKTNRVGAILTVVNINQELNGITLFFAYI